eukprot:TRINITY_DN5416_c0_g1_i2.p1 TRINITY_DN5416_c0_g1~~TRINITY_DN5416_c0_g1_i2.p1  ORF type:complete len:472 (+),score=78.37 TRINITY_DN5416_c0_g1_i2:169-1584(+)
MEAPQPTITKDPIPISTPTVQNTNEIRVPIPTDLELQQGVYQPAIAKAEGIELSVKQEQVIKAVMDGFSVCFTGCAGTGKSYLLTELITRLKNKNELSINFQQKVAITASTGIAAINIGGITLHSFAGVQLARNIKELNGCKSKQNQHRWKSVKILIIDEISMINPVLFHRLDRIARDIRNDKRPFGGIQLVLCGDFLQLPPVKNKQKVPPGLGLKNTAKNRAMIRLWQQEEEECESMDFIFETNAWNNCIDKFFELTEVFRQRDEAEFVSILSRIRKGVITDEDFHVLNNTKNNYLNKNPKILPTVLYAMNRDVRSYNTRKLDELPDKLEIFNSTDKIWPSETEQQRDANRNINILKKMLDHGRSPQLLNLKIGAQVMITYNIDHRIVNGTRGVIMNFIETEYDQIPETPVVGCRDWFDANSYTIEHEQENKQVCLIPLVNFDEGGPALIFPRSFGVLSSHGAAYRTQLH